MKEEEAKVRTRGDGPGSEGGVRKAGAIGTPQLTPSCQVALWGLRACKETRWRKRGGREGRGWTGNDLRSERREDWAEEGGRRI